MKAKLARALFEELEHCAVNNSNGSIEPFEPDRDDTYVDAEWTHPALGAVSVRFQVEILRAENHKPTT